MVELALIGKLRSEKHGCTTVEDSSPEVTYIILGRAESLGEAWPASEVICGIGFLSCTPRKDGLALSELNT